MSLTLKQVEHIAELARLELSEGERKRFQQQVSAILDYFDQLQSVDTSQVPPTSSVQPSQSRLRADEPHFGLEWDQLARNAPKAEKRQFRVPPVFE
jgi:aspartyl-tRNA(Asn)/glutamyl-tRNA(Gln) amidotransferase subunit C